MREVFFTADFWHLSKYIGLIENSGISMNGGI